MLHGHNLFSYDYYMYINAQGYMHKQYLFETFVLGTWQWTEQSKKVASVFDGSGEKNQSGFLTGLGVSGLPAWRHCLATYHCVWAAKVSQPWLVSDEATDRPPRSFRWHVLGTRMLGIGDAQSKNCSPCPWGKGRSKQILFLEVGPESLENEEKWANSAWCQQKNFTKEEIIYTALKVLRNGDKGGHMVAFQT